MRLALQKKFYSFSFISNIRTESDLMLSGLPVNIFHELKSMQWQTLVPAEMPCLFHILPPHIQVNSICSCCHLWIFYSDDIGCSLSRSVWFVLIIVISSPQPWYNRWKCLPLAGQFQFYHHVQYHQNNTCLKMKISLSWSLHVRELYIGDASDHNFNHNYYILQLCL